MESENPASSEPAPAVAAGRCSASPSSLFVANWMWPTSSATPPVPASNQARTAQQRRERGTVDPADLDVRLDALSAARPDAGPVERNPFRFQPKRAAGTAAGGAKRAAGDESGPPPPSPARRRRRRSR